MSISILDPDLVQSLQGATAEMKTDKFFRDLAQPIDQALERLAVKDGLVPCGIVEYGLH